MGPASESITPMLREGRRGDEEALARRMPLFYDGLRRPLAASCDAIVLATA